MAGREAEGKEGREGRRKRGGEGGKKGGGGREGRKRKPEGVSGGMRVGRRDGRVGKSKDGEQWREGYGVGSGEG